jgi:hypothetical protein
MRTQTRESWLVPLLAVPLSRIALSPVLDEDDIVLYAGDQAAGGKLQRLALSVEGVIQSTMVTGRALTDEEAVLLVECSHDCLGLGCGFLYPIGYLLVGAGIPAELTGEPLLRNVARWIVEGPQSVAFSALVITHALSMTEDPMGWLPRANSRYAPVTRAIDRRMHDEGITSWQQALAFAHRYWEGRGWLDLQLWQMNTEYRVEEQYIEKPRERAAAKHDAVLSRERTERARLQSAVSALESELRVLRPLEDKVEGLRADAERLRVREAELIQARDRALARIEALEAANAGLERELEEARRRLAELSPGPQPESASAAAPGHEVVYVEDTPLPATLLAGREVFFFTGELRRSSAEATAESLRALGADDIRTFCLRQGSDGPDAYPADALIVVDFRFLGHSQSALIADRAERSGAQYLGVRSGKGSLARVVAAALEGRKDDGA